jgi:hypothetical protein
VPNPIVNLANRIFRSGAPLKGSQVPLMSGDVGLSQREKYDLEIDEYPVRDLYGSLETSRNLIELVTWCYEARHTLSYVARDVLRSRQGQTTGWMIADILKDGSPIDPDVKVILSDLIERKNGDDWVIGGNFLEKAVRWMFGYGDAFIEMSVAREGISSGNGKYGDYGVYETLYLPTWQMFVQEDRQGRVQGFQQRSRLQDQEGAIDFFPQKIIHFMYEEQTKYGMSAFLQACRPGGAWKELKGVNFDIAEAVRSLGINPNIHVMPEGKDEAYKKAYQKRYESLKSTGVVTDMFLLSGADIRKMNGVNSNLDALFRRQLDLRYHIVPSGLPVWFFPGLGVEMRGAREISGEPAKAYDGILASIAFVLSKGIRKMFDLELTLRLGAEEFKKRGHYRILFPDFGAESQEDKASNGDKATQENADPTESTPKPKESPKKAGNEPK